MFDTMVFTKALGAICGALLIFLVGMWIADGLYQPGSRNLPQAFVIDTGDDDEDDMVAEAEPTFDEAFAVATAAAGERVWSQCRACHQLEEGRNAVGPYLHNVMGRQIGAVEGFNYSGALPTDQVWTAAAMDAYLENPRAWAPGTSMAFNGLRDVRDRANIVALLIENSPDFDPSTIEAAVIEEAVEEEAVAEAPAEEAVEEEAVAEAVTEEAVEEEAVAEAPAEEAVEEEAVAEAPAEEAVEEEAVAEAPAEEAVEEEAVAEEAVEELSPIAAAFADGDIDAGQRVFRQCQACHVANAEQNRVGPHLVNLIGREANSVPGFRYSGNLPEGPWTLERLDAYLENPRAFAPGTSMVFQGLRTLEDRANVLAFIDAQG